MSEKTVPRTITHIGLTVPNIDEAIDWYEEIFGFQLLNDPYTVSCQSDSPERHIFGEFDEVTFAHLGTGNQVGLELFEFDTTEDETETEYRRGGLSHFCVMDPNIEEIINRIENSGGTQHSPIRQPFDELPYEFAFCRDPWENHIEIYTHSYERFMTY